MSNQVSPGHRKKPGLKNLRARLAASRPWLAAAFLLLITFSAYTPVIRSGGFIWDDDTHLTGNPLMRSLPGLQSIWTKLGPERGGSCQYYPLTFSVFWAEYQLFQLRPLGYHLLNILLHALNAVLLWRVLRRLQAPGALLAAAIFALHPVCVESVAWVTELKNVLSGLFYLSSLLCYLRFLGFAGLEPEAAGPPSTRGLAPRTPVAPAEVPGRQWPFYFLSIFLFVCALTAKTATVVLPVVILLLLWWKAGRVSRKDLLLASPMLLLACGAGLLTIYVEKYTAGASGPEWSMTPMEHCLLAGRAIWFYAGKLIWPVNLAFIYPRWEVNQAVWWQYLFPLAAAAAVAALWRLRDKIGRGPLTAVLIFVGALAPVMGFLNIYFMKFSYVADHFQYLASMALIVLFAAPAALARERLLLRGGAAAVLAKAARPVSGALLLMLGALTWRQAGVYKDSEHVWLDTLAKNPSCYLAHLNLGAAFAGQGKLEEGITHYREALRLKPGLAEAHNNLGSALTRQWKMEEAVAHYRAALRLDPGFAEAQDNWGLALAKQGKVEEAVPHFREALRLKPGLAQAHNNWGFALAGHGEAREAVEHFLEALRLKPDFVYAHYNLGTTLAGQGRLEEAVKHYREALRLDPGFAEVHNNLGLALARRGSMQEAIAHYGEALRLKPSLAQAHNNCGDALAWQGKMEEAAAHYREALRLSPGFVNAHNGLGIALATLGRRTEAVQHFREAVRLDPNYLNAQKNLRRILGLDRNDR